MERIKELRLKKNWKQSELAHMLQISQNTLSYWEQGKYQPDIETLKKLAEIFLVSVDYLIGHTDNPAPANIMEPEESLVIPDILKNVQIAAHGGDADFTQDEIDKIADFAAFVKSQKKNKARQDD